MELPRNILAETRRILQAVNRAADLDRRLVHRTDRVRIELLPDRSLRVSGEVDSLGIKRRLLQRVWCAPEIERVIDELRVHPDAPMSDDAIRAQLADALRAEPAFAECALRAWQGGELESLRELAAARDVISVAVEAGVVALEGCVSSLGRARLAGVLAWWVPGTRDVNNALVVRPAPDDTDGEVQEAVCRVLQKEPALDATRIKVSVEEHLVELWGVVPDAEQRMTAERDAWFVLGVDDVRNRLEVLPRA